MNEHDTVRQGCDDGDALDLLVQVLRWCWPSAWSAAGAPPGFRLFFLLFHFVADRRSELCSEPGTTFALLLHSEPCRRKADMSSNSKVSSTGHGHFILRGQAFICILD